MMTKQTLESIGPEALLEQVKTFHRDGWRLVQIGANRLPEHLELTYSFDRDLELRSLRLQLPTAEPRVPSISAVFWAAFLYENELHDLFGLEVSGLAVDFGGNFYKTTVKFPFGSTKAPTAAPPASTTRTA